MKRHIRIIVLLVLLIVIGGGTAIIITNDKPKDDQRPSVTVTRGDLTDKAMAVGTLEPRVEISVKSQISGVVSHQFADVGDYVQAGTPLLQIRPTPTPQELVDAKRQVEFRRIELANMQKEFDRQQTLIEKGLVAQQDFEATQQQYDEARLQVQMAEERLELLESGRIRSDETIATVVKAPISGYILDKSVEIGDPVVPLTSYQEGTVLMSMADMKDLIFRGTVDEIDVGRLVEGMPVEIKIGALPESKVTGTLEKIWLKAQKEEGSTVFPIEINLEQTSTSGPLAGDEATVAPAVLRAGYSANAEIIIERREDVLLLPERVITFAGDTARVEIPQPDGTSAMQVIETGLSDAIHIQILGGLDEGAAVLEKPVQQIQ